MGPAPTQGRREEKRDQRGLGSVTRPGRGRPAPAEPTGAVGVPERHRPGHTWFSRHQHALQRPPWAGPAEGAPLSTQCPLLPLRAAPGPTPCSPRAGEAGGEGPAASPHRGAQAATPTPSRSENGEVVQVTRTRPKLPVPREVRREINFSPAAPARTHRGIKGTGRGRSLGTATSQLVAITAAAVGGPRRGMGDTG